MGADGGGPVEAYEEEEEEEVAEAVLVVDWGEAPAADEATSGRHRLADEWKQDTRDRARPGRGRLIGCLLCEGNKDEAFTADAPKKAVGMAFVEAARLSCHELRKAEDCTQLPSLAPPKSEQVATLSAMIFVVVVSNQQGADELAERLSRARQVQTRVKRRMVRKDACTGEYVRHRVSPPSESDI